MSNIKSVEALALRDIAEYVQEEELKNGCNATGADTWFFSRSHFDLKETRRLNRQLGINKLNYMGNKNGKK